MAFEAEDHAILIGIARYPGLTTLGGPEHDAEAVREWLVDPNGGNVDPLNVTVINSAAFPPSEDPEDPYDANPTDTQFRKALNKLCRAPDNSWLPRVGRRLWLFLAGHGFTAGTGSDPSLLTAQAQLGDNAHIAAKRYVDRISNAGFFDEIILVMDACQDVMRSASINDPTWTPPDRSGNATYFGALAAPRGSKSREAPDPSGDIRGFFTSTFIDALKSAAGDAQGWVTAEAVRQEAFNRWNSNGMPARTGVAKPPIEAPFGMNIYRRAVPVPADPGAQGAGSDATSGTRGPVEIDVGNGKAVNVKFDLPVDASLVRIFDHAERQVFHGVPSDLGGLLAGSYTAQVRVGDAVERTSFDVLEGLETVEPVKVRLPNFASPVPLPGTRTTHEWQSGPVADLRTQLGRLREAPRPHRGALLVFARDWEHQAGAAWPDVPQSLASVRLHGIGATARLETPAHISSDPIAGYIGLIFPSLIPGSYALGFRRMINGRPFWQEIIVSVVNAPYRTEVFVGALDDDNNAGRRLDPDGAAILILPEGLAEVDEASTRTEAARLAYIEGRPYAGNGIEMRTLVDTSPIIGLYIAYALTLAADPALDAIRRLLDQLEQGALRDTPDVEALRLWLETQRSASSEATQLRDPPMFARGWELEREVDLQRGQPGHTPGPDTQWQVARWRVASPVWTVTGIAEERRADERLKPGPLLLGLLGIGRIAVNPNASALEQSIRRAVLDRMSDEEQPEAVDLGGIAVATARAWNLQADIVDEAIREVLSAGLVAAEPTVREEGGTASEASARTAEREGFAEG